MQTWPGLPFLVLLVACPSRQADVAAPDPPSTPNDLPVEAPSDLRASVGQPVALRVRDLVVRVEGVEIQVAYLLGRLVPSGEFVDLEDPTSFSVEVDALELRIPEQSLVGGMQGSDDNSSPLRDLSVRTDGDTLVLEGNARLLNLPFTFRAEPTVTDDGELALQLEKVRVLGIGLRGFLDAFAQPVEAAVNKKPQRRILNVEEDLLIVDPFPFAGPPEVHAAFSSVEVHDGGLVARLGEAPSPEAWPRGLSLVGGALRTDNTILFDMTVSLVSRDGGPLVIDPALLDRQIEEGHSKMGERTVTLHVVEPQALGEVPPKP